MDEVKGQTNAQVEANAKAQSAADEKTAYENSPKFHVDKLNEIAASDPKLSNVITHFLGLIGKLSENAV